MVRTFRNLCLLLLVSGAALRNASATFHFMVIDEVYPGSYANPDAQYVVLRSTFSSQDLLAGHEIATFDAAGTPGPNFGVFALPNPTNAALGAHYIMATPQAVALFNLPDTGGTHSGSATGRLPFPSGRICWALNFGSYVDCVAYGNFTGNNGTHGSPAAALVRQRALKRICDLKTNDAGCFGLAAPGPTNDAGTTRPDSDGDGIPDVSDCSPNNSSVYLVPFETANDRINRSPDGLGGFITTIAWDDQSLLVGPSTLYDVLFEDLLSPGTPPPFSTAACLGRVLTAPNVVDPAADPAAGGVRLYLSRARNGCGTGTYGDSSVVPDPRDALDNPATTPCP